MKAYLGCVLVLSLNLAAIHAEERSGKTVDAYRQLKQGDKKAQSVIARLEKIKIGNVSIEGLSADRALEYLRDKVVGGKGGGVINFVIRGVETSNSKVTLQADKMNYAKAVDEICAQTGRQWHIDVDESSGVPLLVLTWRNGQPAAKPVPKVQPSPPAPKNNQP